MFGAGVKSRAPAWLADNHLEWLYRFYQEPWRRWRRPLPKFASGKFGLRLTNMPPLAVTAAVEYPQLTVGAMAEAALHKLLSIAS